MEKCDSEGAEKENGKYRSLLCKIERLKQSVKK
jgi:hypothetical protein